MRTNPLRRIARTAVAATALVAVAAAAAPPPALAQTEAPPAAPAAKREKPKPVDIRIGHIHWAKPYVTLSLSAMPAPNDGIAGSLMAVEDNNTTGRFTNQHFTLESRSVETPEAALKAAEELAGLGISFIVLDVPGDLVNRIADAPSGKDRLFFNVAAKDEALREDACRRNVIHVTASHSMLADALGQYLVWKKWNRWLLLTGALPADKLWAEALKRAAGRFGAEIVEEREYQEKDTARRTDTGHVQVQRQMPVFTQNAPEHDVVVVADESEIFGKYVPFRTWDPRPVAGSGGLHPTTWTEDHEQWGAYQLQNRFVALNNRRMNARDMDSWEAVRLVGEAATRSKSADPAKIIEYIHGPDLALAAFKGAKLTIRPWNNQIRQPVLLADGDVVVSVSPQEGFLHEKTELDTLGYDEPETKCAF